MNGNTEITQMSDSGANGTRRPLTEGDMVRMGLGRRYWEVSLSLVPDSPWKESVENYLVHLTSCLERGWGLWLHGDNRVGKTSLAVIVAKEARRHEQTVFFIEASSFASASIRTQEYDKDFTIEQKCKYVDVLVLDDLGKEHRNSSGSVESEIEELIRERANDRKVTIITSNVPPDAVCKGSALDLVKGIVLAVKVHGPKKGGIDWAEREAKELKAEILGGLAKK